ncbi:MAG: type 4a pilus biogenesis protein PilO [Candidatus Omnitrophota bacterium]
MKAGEEAKIRDIQRSLNLSDRQVRLVVYVVAAVIIALVVSLTHRPLAKRLADAQHKLQLLQSQLEVIHRRTGSLKETSLSEKLLKRQDLSLAIDDITAQGRSLGLKFISITPGEATHYDEGNFDLLPISFKIESSYEAMGSFLLFLEDFSRSITFVENLSIRPKGVADLLDLDVIVSLYLEAENGQK